MRISVLPADDAGCGWYRLRYPAQALIAQGADVVIDTVGPTVAWDRPWRDAPSPTHKVLGFAKRYEADVVVMQRPARRWWADFIPHFQAQGTKVVVDVDDLVDDIHKRNQAYDAHRQDHLNYNWVDEACRLADVVTCTTPALLRRYGHGHGVVLPNLVPESHFTIYGLKHPETVGWAGFVGTHPGDLRVTDGSVGAVIQSSGWGFHVIGDGEQVATDLHLPSEPSVTGRVEFRDYAYEVARLEVGIVPLMDSAFNRAKSCLKAAEMSSLGVAVVMSSTPDNVRLNKLGVGVLADSRGQWRRQLGRLVSDASWRYELADKGREAMRSLTYEAHCGRWLEAWSGQAQAVAA